MATDITLTLTDELHADLTAFIDAEGEGMLYPIIEAGIAGWKASRKQQIVQKIAEKYTVDELVALEKAK